MWKQFVKDYFSFTAKERKGIIILVIIIFFLVFLPYLYPLFNKKEVYNRDEFEKDKVATNQSLCRDTNRLRE